MQSRELVSMLADADEALHQLVGDVIVLGQELAGDIEGDRVRPVLARWSAKRRGDEIERRRPSSLAGRCIIGVVQAVAVASACRPAPRPWSTAGRNSPDAPGRRAARRPLTATRRSPTPQ